MAVLLALVSSVLWGGADFIGGLRSKQRAAYAVVGASQAAGVAAATVAAVVTGGFSSPLGWVLPSVLAGVTGVVALVAFFAALAIGTMGVVAPIAAAGGVIPIVAGLIAGEQPSVLAGVGIALALVGGCAASGPVLRGRGGGRPVVLAAGSAAAFGLTMLFIADGARTDAVMTVWGMRLTITVVIGATALVTRRLGGLRLRDAGPLVLVGVGATSANLLFGLATRVGLVSVSAALASLSPVTTGLLAWAVLRERLLPIQYAGVAVALVGVTLMSVG
jgi:drug/metabolite transporter (DMT)-like permease